MSTAAMLWVRREEGSDARQSSIANANAGRSHHLQCGGPLSSAAPCHIEPEIHCGISRHREIDSRGPWLRPLTVSAETAVNATQSHAWLTAAGRPANLGAILGFNCFTAPDPIRLPPSRHMNRGVRQ
jgi:hypothetical protein